MSHSYFHGVDPIRYEGPQSHNPLAFRWYDKDRIVLGDDYPADMGYKKPVEVVERLTQLSQAQRDMILGGNARRLLKLAA